MPKNIRFALFLAAFVLRGREAAANSARTVIYKGLGMTLESRVDAMTDRASCALFVEGRAEGVYLAIYGPSDFTVWTHKDGTLFASDATHLLRIGKAQPVELGAMSKRNGLKPNDAAAAKALVRAIARRSSITIRYFDWPHHDPHDVAIDNPNVGYVYAIGVKNCG